MVTQLPHKLFGIEVFSLKNAYLRCIGEQLRNELNDKGKLGTIYRVLTHYILAKYGGAENIPRIRHHDCNKSPTMRTLYLSKIVGGAHLRSKIGKFPLESTPLEREWHKLSTTPPPQKLSTRNSKYIHKLLLENIYDIKQLTLPNGTHLMSYTEYSKYYKKPTHLIKQALKTIEQPF